MAISTSSDINAPNGGSIDVKDISSSIIKNYSDISMKLLNDTYGDINKLQEEVAKKQTEFIKFYYTNAKNANDQELKNLNQQKAAFANVNEELKKIIKLEEEKSKKAWGILTFGMSDLFFDLKKGWKEVTKPGGDLRDKTMGIASMAGGIASAFKPLVDYLIDVLFMNDKMQTDIARNLGIQKDQTTGILNAYIDMAASSGLQVGLAKDLIEAQSQITHQYNLQQPVSDEILVAQVQMTKEMGLQAQEASRLNSIFLLNGNQGREGLDVVYKQVAEFANQNKILFSGKGILSEISKLSGQIRASFKGSTEEMANAVLQASKLGTTLDQTRSMSESLLNFESSIDNELKAELLTGQQLNLEKARALALSGKYVDAGKEMLEQAGGLDNFQKLNVIQQRALAEAVGLTGDQMADVLFKQSETGKYANELATKYESIHQYDIAQRMKRGELSMQQLRTAELELTAQQKFETSMERVKEIFAGLVDSKVLDKMANFAEVFTKRLASGSLLGAILHNYSTDLAELDAKKLATTNDTENKEDTVAKLKEYAKTAQEKAKLDAEGPISSFFDKYYGYMDPTEKGTVENYKEQRINEQTKEYYEKMISLLSQNLKNPVPVQLSTSVLSQFMIDSKAIKTP